VQEERNSQSANAFEVLARDHAEVKQMLTQLELGAVRQDAAGDEQLSARKQLAEQLNLEESKHWGVEEMYFWPGLRASLTAEQADEPAETRKVTPTSEQPSIL
jgi:hypothetical protein